MDKNMVVYRGEMVLFFRYKLNLKRKNETYLMSERTAAQCDAGKGSDQDCAGARPMHLGLPPFFRLPLPGGRLLLAWFVKGLPHRMHA